MLFRKLAGSSVVLVAAALGVGCGDGSESSAKEESTPQEARAEVAKTRAALDQAVKTYTGGDHAAAEKQVGDAYLEHFEHVEGQLGKVNERLNEELEEQLSQDLRAKMKANAPDREIEALAAEIRSELDSAEAALR
jgi:hypothetical protein